MTLEMWKEEVPAKGWALGYCEDYDARREPEGWQGKLFPDAALALIEREWGAMLARGATTTWEGFLGDAKDSLCHPFSTAPLLFLLS